MSLGGLSSSPFSKPHPSTLAPGGRPVQSPQLEKVIEMPAAWRFQTGPLHGRVALYGIVTVPETLTSIDRKCQGFCRR